MYKIEVKFSEGIILDEVRYHPEGYSYQRSFEVKCVTNECNEIFILNEDQKVLTRTITKRDFLLKLQDFGLVPVSGKDELSSITIHVWREAIKNGFSIEVLFTPIMLPLDILVNASTAVGNLFKPEDIRTERLKKATEKKVLVAAVLEGVSEVKEVQLKGSQFKKFEKAILQYFAL